MPSTRQQRRDIVLLFGHSLKVTDVVICNADNTAAKAVMTSVPANAYHDP